MFVSRNKPGLYVSDSHGGSCLCQHRRGPVIVSGASQSQVLRVGTLCLPPARMHCHPLALEASHTRFFVGQTFCELTALFKWAKSEFGSTVPRNMDLYWFMPAFVNNNVGSESGTTEEEGTRSHVKSAVFST